VVDGDEDRDLAVFDRVCRRKIRAPRD
jgi:hypothetical protein